MARLLIEGGAFASLSSQKPCLAGRLQSCELTLGGEGEASRRHFQVQARGSRFVVQDLGSRNGTYLNGERLTSDPVPLTHGDVLRVGGTKIRYESAAPVLPPGTDLGGCAITERLARSRYGTLYVGKQGSLERAVTVEVADPDLAGDDEFRAFYEQRARQGGAIDHPAVRAVFDVKRSAGGILYTVFEALTPNTLASELERRAFDHDESLQILLSSVRALAQVHKLGKHHGSFGPKALRRDEKGAFKLCELGDLPRLAPYRADGEYHSGYASPEEARGHPPGRAADLYSLGVLGHRLFLGTLPYTGSLKQVLTQHGSAEAVPLSGRGLPPPVESLLADLLDKVPAERPTAPEALERLEAIARGEAGPSAPTRRPRKTSSANNEVRRRSASGRLSQSGSARAKRTSSSANERPTRRASSGANARPASGGAKRGSSGGHDRLRDSAVRRSDSAPQRRPISARASARVEALEPDPLPLAIVRLLLVLTAYAAVALGASALTRMVLRAAGV